MPTINDIKLLQFPQLGDKRGHLVVVEGETTVPFEVKRVFYIYGSDADVIRGQHANRITDFVLINVSGTSKVRIVDGKGGTNIIGVFVCVILESMLVILWFLTASLLFLGSFWIMGMLWDLMLSFA